METTVKTKWNIDTNHSELLFKVKHLMITNIKGEFRKFSGEICASNDDFTDADIKLTIDVASVFTNNDDRDNHLRSADFFDSEKYPQMTFESTSLKQIVDDQYKLTGFLTIKGITKEVELNAEFGGLNTDPWGNQKAGFSISGSFNRTDWGLNWNSALETGGVLVGEEVKMSAEVQLVKLS
jgi:polyisoprenoid-binding protein YceI